LTSLAAVGHFNSLLPLAVAARAAGHEVGICTGDAFRADAEAMGMRFFAGGASTMEELMVDAPRHRDERRAVWTQRTVFGTRAPQRLIPDLLRHVETWRPDVIVRESAEYAGCLVAEKVGIPHASLATGSTGSQDDRPRLLGSVLNERRRELGMEPDPASRMMFRYLHFALTPPRWEGDSTPSATTHHLRYENPPRAGEHRPEWLGEPRTEPLVLASLGTLMYREPGLLQAIVEAVADEPMQVVVVIGDQDPASFGSQPRNVRFAERVPQITVLSECDLFITHGGFNSTKEALSFGLPLVVLPIGGDQPFTARRVAALGLGLAVAPEEREPDIIRARVRRVLQEPEFRASARAFADEMEALPPMSHAVGLLERLVQEKRPILRES
jgi:UDP:flavonoid glycosyltransferase YjiC (YdhE family)